jgi:hypothetical protein
MYLGRKQKRLLLATFALVLLAGAGGLDVADEEVRKFAITTKRIDDRVQVRVEKPVDWFARVFFVLRWPSCGCFLPPSSLFFSGILNLLWSLFCLRWY